MPWQPSITAHLSRRYLLVIGAVGGLSALLGSCSPGAWNRNGAASGSNLEPLSIRSGATTHHFTVELARTSREQERGLMFREHLPPDQGMLFDLGKSRLVSMTMKNTRIPLDMLFIDANGHITNIETDTVPFSEIGIGPVRLVRAVLELNAGTAARLGLRPGDIIQHPIFASAPDLPT
jgi:uncharacterized membrane protein (UPF0127 family)